VENLGCHSFTQILNVAERSFCQDSLLGIIFRWPRFWKGLREHPMGWKLCYETSASQSVKRNKKINCHTVVKPFIVLQRRYKLPSQNFIHKSIVENDKALVIRLIAMEKIHKAKAIKTTK